MIECLVQLIDGVRAEGIADIGPVERDTDRAAVNRTVLRDVGKGEPCHLTPLPGIEDLRNHAPIMAIPGDASGTRLPGRASRQ